VGRWESRVGIGSLGISKGIHSGGGEEGSREQGDSFSREKGRNNRRRDWEERLYPEEDLIQSLNQNSQRRTNRERARC